MKKVTDHGTTAEELMITEERLIKVSASVIYGAACVLAAAAVWLATVQFATAQTRKDLDDHLRTAAENHAINEKRWTRVNNALLRLQYANGIKIPRSELDPLDE